MQQTGLLPTLVKSLAEHSALAQRTSDAAVLTMALAHLSRCRTEFINESEFIKEGKLPQAVKSSQILQKLIKEAPDAAAKAEVTKDLKVRGCALFLVATLIILWLYRGSCESRPTLSRSNSAKRTREVLGFRRQS